MKSLFLLTVILCIAFAADAQNVGIGTTNPDASAKLDVTSTDKGMLVPRMTEAQRNAISAPATGLLIYQTDNTPGFYYYNGSAWGPVSKSGAGNTAGYGTWGDCSSNNISEYYPVTDATGSADDDFGYSVSISGNCAIVGAPYDDVGTNVDQGSASIYQWDGTGWVMMQKLTDATGSASDYFGTSVSISGNYAIVGARYDDVGSNINQGSASIYHWDGGNWVLMQKLTDATGSAYDYFGNSVSISGNYAIVGATYAEVSTNNEQGSVSIYQWDGANWVLMQKLTDATGSAFDYFGTSVSISGNYAIIGASGDDVGTNIEQGSASIYHWDGTNWVLMQKLTDAYGGTDEHFGGSVSISGNYAIVGAYNDVVGTNTDQGSASIYHWDGTNWVMMQKLTDAT
ncbi:MAG: FG-GAP repeat protein, partial [Chitinophagaceae bacterium]|nr:FG-GAP repeat protein [Chitinophagaceae bacterium]